MAGTTAPRRAAVALIRAYQLTFSAVLGRQCRYLPTCSDYAAEAVRRHGLWPGVWMAGARLCRCHPWGAWGYDPVPRRCKAVPFTRPWHYGIWRMPPPTNPCEPDADQERASSSAAKP